MVSGDPGRQLILIELEGSLKELTEGLGTKVLPFERTDFHAFGKPVEFECGVDEPPWDSCRQKGIHSKSFLAQLFFTSFLMFSHLFSVFFQRKEISSHNGLLA